MKRLLRTTITCLCVLLLTQILSAAEVNPTNEGNTAAQFALEKKVDVQIKDMLLPDALAILLKDTGIAHEVDPEVAQLKVTADFKGVTLQLALTELERVSNTIIGIGSGGIGGSISLAKSAWLTGSHPRVFVLARHENSPRSAQIEGGDVTVPEDARAIPLKHYTGIDMLLILEVITWEDFLSGKEILRWSKGPIPYHNLLPKDITSIYIQPGGKALFVIGKETAVAELTELISKIDIEPRQVTIHIARYALGTVIPESIEFEEQGITKMASVKEVQLEALTSELHDKGIEPTVTANIPTLSPFPVATKLNWQAPTSSMPVRAIELLVAPRLYPVDSSVHLNIYMQYTMGGLVYQSKSFTGAASGNLGMSAVIFETSDSIGGGALTILTVTQ